MHNAFPMKPAFVFLVACAWLVGLFGANVRGADPADTVQAAPETAADSAEPSPPSDGASQEPPPAEPARPPARPTGSDSPTYIIPLRGMIESGMLFAIDRQLERARNAGADVIVLHMNTPGGMLTTTEHLMRMLADLPEDIRTYTYVDKDALSAGAFIAMATDAIYMAPQSRIGASALVTPFGDLKEGDMKEKSYSASMSLIQSIAAQKGYDPDLIEAMMRTEFEYKIGEETLSPAGRLLTLSTDEAARMVERNGKSVPLLSSGTARNLDELLDMIGRADTRIVTPLLTPTETLIRYAKLLAVLFLAMGVLGLYIEIRTPGFGIPGVIGLFGFMLYFWAQNIAGTGGTIEALVFIVGLGLLLLEIFVIPGFGVTGIAGLILMGGSVFAAMIRRLPGETGWFAFPEMQVSNALAHLGGAVIVAGVGMLVLTRLFEFSPAYSHLALLASLDQDKGYGPSDRKEHLLDATGKTRTALHPAGIAEFDGKKLDVVSRGEFIEADTPVRIVETRGNRIVVEPDPTTNDE